MSKANHCAETLRRWRLSEMMRKAALGEYVAHGFSYFTKDAVDELKEINLRFAGDNDAQTETLYMENIDGHLRAVKVCRLEKPAQKNAMVPESAKAGALPQVRPAFAGTSDDLVQNPPRATISPPPTISVPSARPV